MFFLAGLYKMIMVSVMDDISGKKFSLQDWVTRRAANQAGGIASRVNEVESIQPVAIKRAVNGDDSPAEQETAPETLVSSSMSGDAVNSPSENTDMSVDNMGAEDKGVEKPTSYDQLMKAEMKSSYSSPNSSGPVQQLQIVRLLTDLGERLRQSEKEREILWKEVETCRKQIGDLNDKNSQSVKSFENLQGKLSGKEDFIQSLIDKQAELETLVKSQSQALESAQSEQAILKGKLEDKLSSIETAAGSAIVRIEDALVENSKLAKRVEQLGQDKARLVRKLEVMEETLTQTQETLKAKALVLLTDQALAARTNLPQSQAWTGDDTLRVSTPRAEKISTDTGPLSDIAESIRQQQKAADISNKAFLIALFVLIIASGVLVSQINFKSLSFTPSSDKSSSSLSVDDEGAGTISPDSNVRDSSVSGEIADDAHAFVPAATPSQEELMANIATIANQIEPSSVDPTEIITEDTFIDVNDFDKAIDAEDKALEVFNSEAPKGSVKTRIKPNASLPKAVKDIENLAFEGDAKAQHDLAAIYTAGHAGVKVNYDLAAKWFTESAHQNIANAQYNLGVLTQQGLGVEKNVARAIDLYRVAAANSHPEAQYNLAIAYIEGVGTEYNPQIAAAYFQKAASGGIVEGAYNLGLLYENGLLGESQPDEAVFWYYLAAAKGSDQAKDALSQLQNQLSMSDDDVKRIVDRVAQGKPGFLNAKGEPTLPDIHSVTDLELGDSSSTPALSAGAISKSADSSVIFQIQEQLSALGYYKGTPDGVNSNATKSAITAYQRENGLKQDGIPNETLLVQILATKM
ncbi:MAG: peptidoglycan-binding protein [Pseudobdellovibrionaceae bacterium]|jgi:TPR repeat protein|nr:peptidoglycan-binding protein [Pseudobdellovibrionaceae bacterium]